MMEALVAVEVVVAVELETSFELVFSIKEKRNLVFSLFFFFPIALVFYSLSKTDS